MSAPTPAPLSAFPLFPHFPTEVQLQIFSHASTLHPRTIDIWSDWHKNASPATVSYIQHYLSLLSPLASVAPALLSVSRSARSECLLSYSREFRVDTRITTDSALSMPATLWLNFQIDTLVPRGFWNLVSFEDFCARLEGRLGCVAIDVTGCFWRENLRDYCRRRCWVLNGVGEVLLYDSSKGEEWKGSEYLDDFRKRVRGKREMRFVDLDADWGEARDESEEVGKVKEVETFLKKVFDVIESGEDVSDDAEFGTVRKAQFVSMEQTPMNKFRRPVVRLVRMITEMIEESV